MRKYMKFPSPATVLAVLALIVASSGVSYAAASIGTSDLRKNAVTSKKIKDRTIKVKDMSPAARTALKGQTGPAGPAGPSGPAGASPFADVGVATSTTAFNTGSSTYVDVPNASTTITVPPGKTATVLAHFSAETTCTGAAGDWCAVRTLLNGVEMNPAEGLNAAFDSADDGGTNSAYEHNALVRSRPSVGPGTHTITVQAAVFGATDFRLDDLSLAVQAIE